MLTMDGRTILNIRDFYDHFSLTDALRQHRDFAAFAVRSLSRMDDISRAMGMLFALCSMRLDGRMDALQFSTLPHLKVTENELRTLLDEPLPAPEKAAQHVCDLVRCFAQEEQTMMLVPQRSSRLAAAFAASCDLSPAHKKALFVMILAACRLANFSWDRAALTPQQACDALLGRCHYADDAWIRMPPSGDLLLPEREEPWPAWLAEPAKRTLPDGTRLGALRIQAKAHEYGSHGYAAVVQFFAAADTPAPLTEIFLHDGEYVTVTTVTDSSGSRMPLPPRSDTITVNSDTLDRPSRKSDALTLNRKPVTLSASSRLTGFSPDGSGGLIVLADGIVDASAFTRKAFLLDFLLDVHGERFIDVAIRDSELALLCPDGHVLSSFDHLRTTRAVLTLDDYFV